MSNPHSLTINQHIFPSRSIERFYDAGDGVEVYWVKTRKIFLARANNPVFCASRIWDQRSEEEHKSIEDAYQQIVDLILVGRKNVLTGGDTEAIDKMFALWSARDYLNSKPFSFVELEGIEGPLEQPDVAELDGLEKLGFAPVNPDGSLPGRAFAWPFFQRNIEAMMFQLRRRGWGIVTSTEAEFLVPDRFLTPVLPITPKKALVWGNQTVRISKSQTEKVNGIAAREMRRYCFAKDLKACPLPGGETAIRLPHTHNQP